MSGGHWGYLGYRLDESVDRVVEGTRFLVQAEHEMDWGISGDTCYECAKLRTVAALEALFDKWNGDDVNPLDVLADRDKHLCPRCEEWATRRASGVA